jgi:hypothetical protein
MNARGKYEILNLREKIEVLEKFDHGASIQ